MPWKAEGVHVVTVNDYLARRDMEWMGPLYMSLGLTVGAIQSQMDAAERQKAYACDITYGTNNEFGFDYLRDNMRTAARDDDHYRKAHAAGAGPAALCHHRRSGQHSHRRGPHAADHFRPGPRRRDAVREGRTHRPAIEEGHPLSRSTRRSTRPTSPTKAFARPNNWPAWRASTRPATWSGRT